MRGKSRVDIDRPGNSGVWLPVLGGAGVILAVALFLNVAFGNASERFAPPAQPSGGSDSTRGVGVVLVSALRNISCDGWDAGSRVGAVSNLRHRRDKTFYVRPCETVTRGGTPAIAWCRGHVDGYADLVEQTVDEPLSDDWKETEAVAKCLEVYLPG